MKDFCLHTHTHTHTHTHAHIYVYIYIEREMSFKKISRYFIRKLEIILTKLYKQNVFII